MVKKKSFFEKSMELAHKAINVAFSLAIITGLTLTGYKMHRIIYGEKGEKVETEVVETSEPTCVTDSNTRRLLWGIDRAWENKISHVCNSRRYNKKACDSVKKYKENALKAKHEGWDDLISSALRAEDKIKSSVLPFHMRNNPLLENVNVLMLISIATQEVTNEPGGGRTYETTKRLFNAQNLATLPSIGDRRYSVGVYQTLYDTYNKLQRDEKVYKKNVRGYKPLLKKKFEDNVTMYDQSLAALYLTYDNLSAFHRGFFRNCKKCKYAWNKANSNDREDFLLTIIAMAHNSGINSQLYRVFGEVTGDGGRYKANTRHTINKERPSLSEITSKLNQHSVFSSGGRITNKHVRNTRDIYSKLRKRRIAMR